MKIRYTRRAFDDREAIFEYLNQRSPKGALAVQRSIRNSIRALGAHPRLGRPTDFIDIHELTVPRHPYKIYYRIEGEEIWLLHIRDARRSPWPGREDAYDE